MDWTRLTFFLPSSYTLKFRIKFFLTILLTVVVGAPLGLLIYQLDMNREEFSTNLVETTSHAVYQSIFDDLLKNDAERIQKTLEDYRHKPNIELLRLYRPDGTVIHSSNAGEVGKKIAELKSAGAFIRELNPNENESFVKQGNILSHHHPIMVQQECASCHRNVGDTIAIMDVQLGLSDSDAFYTSTKRLLMICAVLMIVILWFSIHYFFETQIEERLLTIEKGFRAVGRGELNHRLQVSGKDELGVLAGEFNEMVSELQTARQREEELVQENLARADRLITMGEVTAEIAHEVNNPAGIILTRAELVRDELENSGNGVSEFVADMDIIIHQTEKIAQTTHSILQYARKLPSRFEQVDVSDAIRRSVDMLMPRIRKHGMTVTIRGADAPLMIWGNFHQLEQVFCNLVNNSLDATPHGTGRVDFWIQPWAPDDGKKGYRIIYSDNGCGIPKDIRQDIFSPFFTTKSPGKGTGLGLFIAHNIISQHNGRIYLSEPRENGTTFIIDLGV